MRNRRTLQALSLAVLLACTGASPAPPEVSNDAPVLVRELFVPVEDLHILLEHDPHRVMLPRDEYEELIARVQREAVMRPPQPAVLVEAVYHVEIQDERAVLLGDLQVNVMDAGLQTIDLSLAGVGLRQAMLDDRPAPIGVTEDGRVRLFVEGRGMHTLTLEMVAPIATTAARQVLDIQLPTPAAARVHLTVPGDVEIVSGAKTISRTLDDDAEVTRFELVPRRERLAVVMTLNSRTRRQDRVVIARSVMVDEITAGYERLHATFSLEVLHRGVDELAWRVPEDFEIREVHSNELARWSIESRDGQRHLVVQLRATEAGRFVVHIVAERLDIPWSDWSFPRLQPVDVEGHVAVLGVLLEERIQATRLHAAQLIPIDTTALIHALPPSVARTEAGVLRVRPVVAYYAPQPAFELHAAFIRPEPRFRVTENLLLTMSDAGLHLRGGLTLAPEVRAIHDFTFTLPVGWQLHSVRGADNQALACERYEQDSETIRYHVRLPQGVAPAAEYRVHLEAEARPPGWLGEWTTRTLAFPEFRIEEATHVTGALAVAVRDDLHVQHESLERLEPLDDDEKPRYGLGDVPSALAYRFGDQEYRGDFHVSRRSPRMTGRAWSFFTVAPDVLHAHYELLYEVTEARTKSVSFTLPADTPPSIAITGLDGVTVKEHASAESDGWRRWQVHLARPQLGPVRLAVSFQQPLPEERMKHRALPVPVLQEVLYQSGYVSVEGHAELDVSVTTDLGKVDVGELADAHYMPGKRLLGVYRYVGEEAAVRFSATRHPFHELKSVIVERAELATMLSAHGRAQSTARYALRTKTDYLEVMLPAGAELWAIHVDGVPARPQRLQNRLLISLPPRSHAQLRDLQIVFESPVEEVKLRTRLDLLAPELYVRDATQTHPVPTADLKWTLYLPEQLALVDAGGTLVTAEIEEPRLAVVEFARAVFNLAGGVNLFYRRGMPKSLALATGELLPDGSYEAVSGRAGRVTDVLSPAPEERAMTALQPRRYAGSLTHTEVEGRASEDTFSVQPPAKPTYEVAADGSVARTSWSMLGIRSLPVDLELSGRSVSFHSLGDRPRLDVMLARSPRMEALRLGLAGLVVLIGLVLTRHTARRKSLYIVAIALITTLVPLLFGRSAWVPVMNLSFHAAMLVALYYVLLAGVHWAITKVRGWWPQGSPAAAAAALVLAAVIPASSARAEDAVDDAIPFIVQGTKLPYPVSVPPDAILVPYDPEKGIGVPDVQQILVPYAKYIELRDLAWPDQRLAAAPPPAPFAWAGGRYTVTLAEGEELLLEGVMHLDVFTEEFVTVPIPLAGGVLSLAELNGRPARLSTVQVDPRQDISPRQQATVSSQTREGPPGPLLAMHVQGKGRYEFRLAVRTALRRQGGWRLAEVRLPTAPVTGLDLTVREARTELRLRGVRDRAVYETTEPDQRITTALEMHQPFGLQWRPRITEGQVDRTLTAESDALFDIQEDGLRLTWQCELGFQRGQRELFQFLVPADYLIAGVEGDNVRGWESRAGEDGRVLDVHLLKPARDRESLRFHLWRQGNVGEERTELTVPQIIVRDAALHHGRVALRRSPLIDARTIETLGVTRDDFPDESALMKLAEDQSPLGLKGFQAYRFAATPFVIRLSAATESADFNAVIRTLFRIGEYEQNLETEVTLTSRHRPLYQLSIALPDDLKLDNVVAPAPFEWAVVQDDGGQRLDIQLASGRLGSTKIALFGKLGPYDLTEALPVPHVTVLQAESQRGQIAIQTDPDYTVRPEHLENLSLLDFREVHSWIEASQRHLLQLALSYNESDYAGTIRLLEREPHVTCRTITNLRITEEAVQETILLDYDVSGAGIRSLTFLLPSGMKDARIRVPQLRTRTITPVSDEPGAALRVTLELQNRILGQIRVLVEDDRLLTQETHEAPIPVPQQVGELKQFVVLESAGREEVEIVSRQGLMPLSRRQSQWETLTSILGNQVTQAFLVESDTRAVLAVRTRPRARVETAGARIGLSQTVIVVDARGAYRAVQTYRVDNSTEQYLEIELPGQATLWTAFVAGEPVKPAQTPSAAQGQLRIPLVKTATGDLDYEVRLTYGGVIDAFHAASRVQFPFIRTLNINVELSQVELYLPEEYAWFDFDGTMTQVTDEGDYLADLVAYQTKRVQKLSRSMRSESEYAQVRALSNWEGLKSELSELQRTQTRAMTQNPRLQQELQSNVLAIEDAERRQTQAAAVFEDQVTSYNRGQLGEYFARQDNTRARGATRDVGANFNYSAIREGGRKQDGQQTFDEKWLHLNALAAPMPVTTAPAEVDSRDAPAGEQAGQLRHPAYGSKAGGDGGAVAGNVVLELDLYQRQAKPSAPQVVQSELETLDDGRGRRAERLTTGQDSTTLTAQPERFNRAVKYRQRLEEADGEQAPVASDKIHYGMRPLGGEKAAPGERAGDLDKSNLLIITGSAAGDLADLVERLDADPVAGRPAAERYAPAVPQGLASLDINIPRQGRIFRFSTPRGDVRIAARAVSETSLSGWKQVGYSLLLAVILLAGYRIFRPDGLLARHPRQTSYLLMLVGLATLVLGVLPLAGLILLLVGIGCRLRVLRPDDPATA